ncbi:hypothetical protein JG687_00002564 [Phytophthora cactorum]|uniref:Necrosis inducing protein n=1 Tax=Phytophthora cactorum TaxID=29920 RepID=A0A8T1UYP9_9STRA|nr:hypothetical protein JG687_00002564 [Phytophthora cactorum]
MNLLVFATSLLTALVACATATVGHDKPQLNTPRKFCVPFPAVNAAGGTTGGLNGTNGNDASQYAPLGSQVYGRAGVICAL